VVLDLFEANRELEGTTSLVVLVLGSKADFGLVCGRYISGIMTNISLVLNQYCLKSLPARHWYKVSIASVFTIYLLVAIMLEGSHCRRGLCNGIGFDQSWVHVSGMSWVLILLSMSQNRLTWYILFAWTWDGTLPTWSWFGKSFDETKVGSQWRVNEE
jgi:hypothetical protein